MIIIETCPKCGHDLEHLVLTCNPPIPQKYCPACGWSWTGKREEVVRVPFKEENIDDNVAVPPTAKLTNLVDVSMPSLANVNAEDAAIQILPFTPTDATVINVNFNTSTGEFESPEE